MHKTSFKNDKNYTNVKLLYFFSFHQPPLLGLSWYIVISLSHTHGLVLFSMFFWIVVYEGLSCLGFLEVFFHVNETTFLLVSFINWIMKNEQWLHVVCYLKRVILLESEIKNHVYGHTHTHNNHNTHAGVI